MLVYDYTVWYFFCWPCCIWMPYFLLKCFYVFFFFPHFVLVIFLWAFISNPPQKKEEIKKSPKTSKLQMLNVIFCYIGSQAKLFLWLICVFIRHMWCPKFWFPSHKPICSKKKKMFNGLCSSKSCLILGLPFCWFSALRKYDTYPFMHHL